MVSGSYEVVIAVVILIAIALERVVEMVLKPLMLDLGVKIEGDIRKPLIYVLLLAVGFIGAAGLDLDLAGEYLTDFDPVITAMLSAAGYAGLASAAHDIMKGFRAEMDDGEGIELVLPALDYASSLGHAIFDEEGEAPAPPDAEG